MNVLIVTAMFPPIRTGTSFYSKNLAQALQARGHQTTLVTLQNNELDGAVYDFPVHRLKAMHIPAHNYFKHFRISSVYLQNYRELNRIAKHCKAEVILLVNHYLDIAFPAIATARLNKIPLVCSVGTQIQSSNPRRDKLLNILDRAICGRIFAFCDQIIAWDKQIYQYIQDVHSQKSVNKTTIVNYGINGDPALFVEHDHDYKLQNQILGVGAVIEQRSFIPLIHAFKALRPLFPELRLKIIGHVYYDAAVKLTQQLGLSAYVTFTGELPHAEVLAELKRSDLFFSSLTGKYLGLGTATIESMLMGVPTIVNAPADLLGGPLLQHMENIVLSEGLDISQIEEKIRLLLSSLPLRKKIGEQGRQFILEHMNWEKVAEKMEGEFATLVQARS